MNEIQIWKMITDYGIAIVGLVFLTRFLMWLIKYILERNKERETTLLAMMTNDIKHLSECMNTLTLNMTTFTSMVNEAHKFQRDEHKEMISVLQGINGRLSVEKK